MFERRRPQSVLPGLLHSPRSAWYFDDLFLHRAALRETAQREGKRPPRLRHQLRNLDGSEPFTRVSDQYRGRGDLRAASVALSPRRH